MRILFLLLCTFWTSLGITEEPYALYLTWQHDPTRTMTVQWITPKENADDSLEYRVQGDTKWQTQLGKHKEMPQDEPFFVHVVELQDLTPDSVYYFRLKESDTDYHFRTLPKDLNETPVVFLVGGDTNQLGPEGFAETNIRAAKEDPSFVVFGGDLAYASPRESFQAEDADRWLEWIKTYSDTMKTTDNHLIPLLVAIGNHDVKGGFHQTPEKAPFFHALFSMPGYPGYNVVRANSYLSFYLLDSSHSNPVKGVQTDWLKTELDKDSKMIHRFAIYHVPAYPSVRSYNMDISNMIRRNWLPLFEKYGVHVAFENHDHDYKRTYPLIKGKIDPRGVVYIGDGSWGVKPRVPKKANKSEYFAKTKAAQQYVKVKLTDSMREFWAINTKGQVIDHYVQFVDKQIPPGEKFISKRKK
jgi:acid phosphatase type 7